MVYAISHFNFHIVGTTPKRTRGRPPWSHKALLRWTRGTSHPLSGRPQGISLVDMWRVPLSVRTTTRQSSDGHVARPTICSDVQSELGSCRPKQNPWPYFAGNHYSFCQKHTRQDIPMSFQVTCYYLSYAACRVKRQVRWQITSLPPQQSLSAACRIMMTLPPSEHHHDCESQRVFPTFKATRLQTL